MVGRSSIGGGVDAELCARSPLTTASSFSQGRQPHIPSIGGLEDGCLGRGIVTPCAKYLGSAPVVPVRAGLQTVATNVAVGLAVLPWLVGNCVDQVILFHVNRECVRMEGPCGSPWGMPDAVGVAVDGVLGLIARLVAAGGGRPAVGIEFGSIGSESGSALRQQVHRNGGELDTIIGGLPLGRELTVVFGLPDECHGFAGGLEDSGEGRDGEGEGRPHGG